MKTRKKMSVISLLLAVSSFAFAAQPDKGNNGNMGNNGNGHNGNIGNGQFRNKAQQMVAKTDAELSIDHEQATELETQAEMMLEGIESASNKLGKQQFSQNYQIAMDHILTEEQKSVKKQKKVQLKSQRKKFGNP